MANFETANSSLESFDNTTLLNSNINQAWENAFMSVMEQCIPQASLPNKYNLPWLNVELTKLMRARNLAYKRAKQSQKLDHWYAYRKKRNKVVNKLKHAKESYFKSLNSSNPKSF